MNMNTEYHVEGCRNLTAAILEQAVIDYKGLSGKGLDEPKNWVNKDIPIPENVNYAIVKSAGYKCWREVQELVDFLKDEDLVTRLIDMANLKVNPEVVMGIVK